MNIHTTLKNIRIEKGMTQEQVADKIGLTRQAISAYESGKRQPGLDILMSLAEFYNVEIEEILYGTKKQNHNIIVKTTAIIFTLIFLLLRTTSCLLTALAFIKYPVEEGLVTLPNYIVLEEHTNYIIASSTFNFFARVVILAGVTALFAMSFCLNTTYKSKHKLLYLFALVSAELISDVFWTIIHPVYPFINFLLDSFSNLWIPVCIIIFNIIISELMIFIKKRNK